MKRYSSTLAAALVSFASTAEVEAAEGQPTQPPAQAAPRYAPGHGPPPGHAPQPPYPPQPAYPPPAGYPPQPGYPPQSGYPQPGYPPARPAYGPYPAAERPAAPAPRKDEKKPERSYLVRLGIGAGPIAPSEHKDLLREDGYSLGTLFWIFASADWLLAEPIGVGVWGAYANGGDRPDTGGPELSYEVGYFGAEVPFVAGSDTFGIVVAPRVGVAVGALSLGTGAGDSQTAPAFGADVGMLLFKTHLGFGFSYLRAPTDPPGEIGRDFDLGGWMMYIEGVVDG